MELIKKSTILIAVGFIAGLMLSIVYMEVRIASISRDAATPSLQADTDTMTTAQIQFFAQEEIRRQLKTKFTGAEWHDSIVTKSLLVVDGNNQSVFSVEARNGVGNQMTLYDTKGNDKFNVTINGADAQLNLFDRTENLGVHLNANNGIGIYPYGSSTPGILLYAGEDSKSLTMKNSQGQDAVIIGTSSNGNGSIALSDGITPRAAISYIAGSEMAGFVVYAPDGATHDSLHWTP